MRGAKCVRLTEPGSRHRVAESKTPYPRLGIWCFGAATQIRTGDLILTKDVLYQLSHSSRSQEYFLVTLIIIPKYFHFVNTFVKFYFSCAAFLFVSDLSMGKMMSIAIMHVNISPNGTPSHM